MARREDCERIVKEAIDGLNGLDIIVSNAVSLACIKRLDLFMAYRPSLLSIMLLLIHCRGLPSFRNRGRKERNLAILIS